MWIYVGKKNKKKKVLSEERMVRRFYCCCGVKVPALVMIDGAGGLRTKAGQDGSRSAHVLICKCGRLRPVPDHECKHKHFWMERIKMGN